MKLIIGLGNPGNDYKNTRHNIGFQLLEYIAHERNIEFVRNKFNADCAEVYINDEKVMLVKPLSYMNMSGSVVERFVSFYKVNLNDILVIQDDLDMNFGRVKIVYNSSSGGHNGIKDIERCLGSKKYARLKIGIANDKSMDTKDYVLGKLSQEEKKILKPVIDKAADAALESIRTPFEQLMSKYNTRVPDNK